MSEVVFDGVTKRFDEVVAVDQLSLEVLNEEFMVLLAELVDGHHVVEALGDAVEDDLAHGGSPTLCSFAPLVVVRSTSPILTYL